MIIKCEWSRLKNNAVLVLLLASFAIVVRSKTRKHFLIVQQLRNEINHSKVGYRRGNIGIGSDNYKIGKRRKFEHIRITQIRVMNSSR